MKDEEDEEDEEDEGDEEDEEDEEQESEWRKASSKSKREITTSMISTRDYSVYEFVLHSEIVAESLVKFCNVILKFNQCLIRWSKIVKLVIEKKKRPNIRKTENITNDRSWHSTNDASALGGRVSGKA